MAYIIPYSVVTTPLCVFTGVAGNPIWAVASTERLQLITGRLVHDLNENRKKESDEKLTFDNIEF